MPQDQVQAAMLGVLADVYGNVDVLLSVCRSSIDDYCPQEQVETIQAAVLGVLADVYGDIEVEKAYEEQQ